MSVPQPTHLLIFNEASGTSITNYGTQGTAFGIGAGSSPTDYQWHQDGTTANGFLDDDAASYLDGKTKTGGNQPYINNGGATPSSVLETINAAIGFMVRGSNLTTGRAGLVCGGGVNYDVSIYVRAPSGGGDFDLQVRVETPSTYGNNYTITGLSYNTEYRLAVSVEILGSEPKIQVRYKLDGNATVTPTAEQSGGTTWSAYNPYLNCDRTSGFTTYGGVDGKYHYFAYQRGGTAWTSTELGNINSDPAGTITGWPAGGGGTDPMLFGAQCL